MTGIRDFGLYLSKLMTIDALFVNEDRHLHNIAVIERPDRSYRLCPIFDNGACLLSDTRLEYPMGEDPCALLENAQSKTLAYDFDDQLEAAEVLYGTNLKFHFSKKDVEKILEAEPYYSEEIKTRVRTIIFEKMRKYSYLFH